MSPLLTPWRMQISADQMAAALSLGGLRPAAWSSLPADPPPADPEAVLEGLGLTASGSLTADAHTALEVLAGPERMLSVIANNARQ